MLFVLIACQTFAKSEPLLYLILDPALLSDDAALAAD